MQLGVYSAARDAYLVLSATAQEQYVRWAATINLMEVASQTRSETLFELYRRNLVGQNMPPYLTTAYELNAGLGYQRFGDFAKARTFLEKALAFASEHGLNQYLFEAEEALLQLDIVTPPHASKEISLDTQEVADAIRELRETADVA
jgi:tetratricopeptide (TPR) repeat protein